MLLPEPQKLQILLFLYYYEKINPRALDNITLIRGFIQMYDQKYRTTQFLWHIKYDAPKLLVRAIRYVNNKVGLTDKLLSELLTTAVLLQIDWEKRIKELKE